MQDFVAVGYPALMFPMFCITFYSLRLAVNILWGSYLLRDLYWFAQWAKDEDRHAAQLLNLLPVRFLPEIVLFVALCLMLVALLLDSKSKLVEPTPPIDDYYDR